jgi:hypothetical protein
VKLRKRKHYNAQEIFLSRLPLNDGGEVSGPNWYFRRKCIDSLRRRYTRMGLYPAGVTTGDGGKKNG